MRPSRNAATATSFAALNAHGKVPPRSPACLARERSGNASSSTASNDERQRLEVEPGNRRRGAIRVRQRVRDRDAHVGDPEMRQQRSVAEPHERVDDRRRVHDDLQLRVGHVEEPMRLDQLEPLVRERGGVDGDLRAHPPGRMRERLGRCDAAELGARPSAERAARGGEDDSGDRVGAAAGEALVKSRMLAVDGEQEASAPLPGRDRELARSDEALLVRERERDAVLERPQRRPDAGEPDDGVEDDVGRAALEQRHRVAPHLDVLHAVLRGDRVEGGRAGLEGAEPQVVVSGDDLDRLPADRAGGSQERDASHGAKDACGAREDPVT